MSNAKLEMVRENLMNEEAQSTEYRGDWDCFAALKSKHVEKALKFFRENPEELPTQEYKWFVADGRKTYPPMTVLRKALSYAGFDETPKLKTYNSCRHLRRLGFTIGSYE